MIVRRGSAPRSSRAGSPGTRGGRSRGTSDVVDLPVWGWQRRPVADCVGERDAIGAEWSALLALDAKELLRRVHAADDRRLSPSLALDGHQAGSSNSHVIAGTRPCARGTCRGSPPGRRRGRSERAQLGMIVSATKVPARMIPALVMTGPGRRQRVERAFSRPGRATPRARGSSGRCCSPSRGRRGR